MRSKDATLPPDVERALSEYRAVILERFTVMPDNFIVYSHTGSHHAAGSYGFNGHCSRGINCANGTGGSLGWSGLAAFDVRVKDRNGRVRYVALCEECFKASRYARKG